MKGLHFFLIIFVFIATMGACRRKDPQNLNKNFRLQLISLLNLKHISSDSMYLGSARIANDTIFGYYRSPYNTSYDDDSKDYYFIQDLKRPGNALRFKSDVREPSAVDTMYRGRVYFPAFGGSTMISVDTTGKYTEYFKAYDDTLFYANNVMLYKDKIAIVSMNGVYLFDINSQKLIWSYKFKIVPSTILAKIIQGKLIFKIAEVKNPQYTDDILFCLNIDSLKYSWKKKLVGEYFQGDFGPYKILRDGVSGKLKTYIFLSSNKRAMVVDLETGDIKHSDPTVNSIQPTNGDDYLARRGNECIFLNKNYKIMWQVKNFKTLGFHNDVVVGTSLNNHYYYVLKASNGKILGKILNSDPEDINLRIMGNFILIDGINLYK